MSLQETANAETPSPDLSSLPATAFPEGADPSTYAASLKADPNAEQEASSTAERPSEWYLLARSDKNLNKDFNGGDASIRKHTLETIDGIKIVKSNITPWADDRANTAIPARYRIATNTTWGAVFTKDAIATAEVMGVSVQSEEQIRKQGHLILARQMTGTDVFRASDAVELRTAAPAST